MKSTVVVAIAVVAVARNSRAALLLCLGAYFLCSSTVTAQDQKVEPYSIGGVFLGNVVIGAAIAAIGHAGHRDEALRAAVKGGAAGVIVFSGKWVVAQNIPATNLLGRQIAAVGSSGVRNAAAGNELFEYLNLVYDPVRLHVKTGPKFSVSPKLDIASSLEL